MNQAVDPSALRERDEPGFLDEGQCRGFALSGDYGTDTEGTIMPYDVAERITRECAVKYREAINPA